MITMRNYHTLTNVTYDAETGLFTLSASEADTLVVLRREGDYLLFSVGIGALEIALRLRYADAAWTLAHIQPNDGLAITRQIGSGQAYLGVGQSTDGALTLRPVVVGDASGQVRANLRLIPAVAQALVKWVAPDPA